MIIDYKGRIVGQHLYGAGSSYVAGTIDIDALRHHRTHAQWDNWMKDLRTELYQLVYEEPIYPKNLYLDRAPLHPRRVPREVIERQIDRWSSATSGSDQSETHGKAIACATLWRLGAGRSARGAHAVTEERGCGTGGRQASESGCIDWCLMSWATRMRLTGSAPAWTVPASGHEGGRRTRPGPDECGNGLSGSSMAASRPCFARCRCRHALPTPAAPIISPVSTASCPTSTTSVASWLAGWSEVTCVQHIEHTAPPTLDLNAGGPDRTRRGAAAPDTHDSVNPGCGAVTTAPCWLLRIACILSIRRRRCRHRRSHVNRESGHARSHSPPLRFRSHTPDTRASSRRR